MELFHDRVGAVFGTLGDTKNAATWSLTRTQVVRSGSRSGNSSDDEQDADVEAFQARLLEEDVFDETELSDKHGMQPSMAFCKALDREEEYDADDAVALSTYTAADTRPELGSIPDSLCSTEVLEGNCYERRCQQNGVVIEPGAPEKNAPAVAPGPSGASSDALLAPMRQPSPRRVRFALPNEPTPYVPPHLRKGGASAQPRYPSLAGVDDGPGPSNRRDPAPSQGHPTDSAVVHAAAQRTLAKRLGRRGQAVPDHVRNPDKYTCYVLDAPITVGGGITPDLTANTARQSQAAGNQLSTADVLPDTMMLGRTGNNAVGVDELGSGDVDDGSSCQVEAERFQAVSGSGVIEFRRHAGRSTPADKHSRDLRPPLPPALPRPDMEVDDVVDDTLRVPSISSDLYGLNAGDAQTDVQQPSLGSTQFKPRGARQRQLRPKPVDPPDESTS